MGADCCWNAVKFEGLSADYKRRLWVVIAINFGMFLIEIAAGALAGSNALQADALDFLADSATYAISRAAIGASVRTRSFAAMGKAASLSVMSLGVLGMTAYDALIIGVPRAAVMGATGVMALAANIGSVLILMRYKDGDANVRSVWLCSRNDAIGNIAVMIAALAVWATETKWPDVIVAALMAGLFLYSSLSILQQSIHEMREQRLRAAGHAH